MAQHQELTLPPAKGADPVPISQLTDAQLTSWEKYLCDQLADDPDGKWAQSNQKKLERVREVQADRASGKATAPKQAPKPQGQRSQETAPQLPPRVKVPEELLLPVQDPAEFTARMSALGEHANLLTSATTLDVLPPGCSITFGKVEVSADPRDADVYPQKSQQEDGASGPPPKMFSLRGNTLRKLANMANIQVLEHKQEFLPGQPGWKDPATGEYPDGRPHPYFQRWTCTGSREELDGNEKRITEEKTVDLRDGSAEAVLQTEKQLARARVNIEQATKTKAKYRMIRVQLGLSDAYTPAQLSKPFVVVRLHRHGNYSTGNAEYDAQIKMLNYLRVHQSHLMLFGKAPAEMLQQARQLLAAPQASTPALPAKRESAREAFDADGVSVEDPPGQHDTEQDFDEDDEAAA